MIESIAKQLYDKKISDGTIPLDLYNDTADKLMKAVFEGTGGSSFDFDDSRNALVAHLRHNIYAFSGAKSLTELKHFNSLLIDAEGKLRPFTDFRNACTDAGLKFNEVWLKTEYDTAEASAQMAVKWTELTENNDYLTYRTVGDNRVRPAHAALDGLTLHKDSPVLRRIWPPCDWECRCDMVPGLAQDVKYTDAQAGALGKQAVTNPLFDHNSGITKTIFEDNHPYFQEAGRKTHQFEAEKNYGLPSIKKLYTDFDFPAISKADQTEDYTLWWRNQSKVAGTDNILIKDKLGQSILFDSQGTNDQGKATDYFKDHILRKKSEKRWMYGHTFPDILKDPDEIWSQKQNGDLIIYHVKYYEDGPYVVVTRDKEGKLVAETMYKLIRPNDIRRGALLFTK